METGRELFDRFLRGDRVPRAAFLPFLSTLAARVGGTTLERMTSDPGAWAASLLKAADLLDADGVVVGFDWTLLAEGCGARIGWDGDRPRVEGPTRSLSDAPESVGRLATALEAARRVFAVCRPRRGCVAALTGPVTLAHQLFGPEEASGRLADAKLLTVRVAEAICRERPDMLCLLERGEWGPEGPTPAHRRVYSTLKNVASYYNIPLVLYLEDYDPPTLASLAALRADVYLLGPAPGNRDPAPGDLLHLTAEAQGLGPCLALDDVTAVDEWARLGQEIGSQLRGWFAAGFDPPGREVDLETAHVVVRRIRELRR
ncbi:MAG: hypothetical protein HZB55_04860 [Deltaproteobacteria bacterium]|nr:hypothetical protein [Deltaproteobacteria bacterium]